MLLTLLQSGGAGPGVITGNLAATESGADTAALAGVVLIQGSIAAQETGSDTLSCEGVVRVRGDLAAQEAGSDTFAATGTVGSVVTGTLAATETGADTFSASGDVVVQGALAVTETGDDAFSAGGVAGITGTLGATETGADAFAATGDTVFFTISSTRALRLLQIHLLHGLDTAAPLTVSPTARQAGAVAQTVVEASGTVTITTTAGATVFAGNPSQMIDDLAALHGITTPLTVTTTSRAAGGIAQNITVAGDITTVTRTA